jgi:hypothetical protein
MSVDGALIGLQAVVVAFIALHDWVPLGRLNDLAAVRAHETPTRLAIVTALSTLPFAVGLAGSIASLGSRFPDWLTMWLWISYGVGLYGMLRTWWGPYLLFEEPARAAKYAVLHGRTHAFLPMHHGMRPNTLHVVFHGVVAAILVLLAVKAGA